MCTNIFKLHYENVIIHGFWIPNYFFLKFLVTCTLVYVTNTNIFPIQQMAVRELRKKLFGKLIASCYTAPNDQGE